ncbi:NUDIX hydrolase [Aureibacillus halotolerans]|uniref:NUDIX domain-containing protein n=1 Tax=Aureibacillus halotolerans TaxID=1508390 RepID=A0A4V3D5E8_9BACI|nr:NUDIX domain-containing protein [Aureibacillus halotolerans]TDQ39807.1 NUDIX domain-containing protein [Aureibacillus halotolerans]
MYPRANTLGLMIKDNCILLEEFEGKHSKGTGLYYRPIGGTIELGERSDVALIREYSEELGVDISINRYMSCIENIFKIDESVGHEITQIYLVDFKDTNLYEKDLFTVTEGNRVSYAMWIEKEDIITGKKILYPDGLTELLRRGFA